MLNPWLALEAGADPAERTRALLRAHEAFLTGAPVSAPVRQVVADSWRRCAGALVRPENVARLALTGADLAAHRDAHPLARVMPVVRELLGSVADDGAHLLSVCDERGRLLWVEGHPQVCRKAERMNFVPGARWAESAVGTNAPGTALAVDHAVQIFTAEHYCRPVQAWTCSAAPVHDPVTGRLLGAVDITGGDHLAAPQSLALVQATVRAAESALAGPAAGRPGAAAPALRALGRDEAVLDPDDGRPPVRLGRRHSEILLLLTAHPDGLSGDRLGRELYGDRDVTPVTLRAEMSRLRQLLGPLLASRPYRLRRPLRTDYDTVREALAADPAGALAAYRGPLLPLSEAPGVVRLRRMLEDRLRQRLLGAADPVLLEEWVGTPWGEHDLEAWEALLGAVPAGDPVRPRLATRVRELRDAFGLPDAYPP
ncbi:helix-turn-helix domain-containing protein [Streptomyces sp. JJ36]|uniref:helix-turn-helix domain-containing protein n=1 Tax=Streptomyces sp. JJ36 TaxID=2736645 RepID=UPI001F3CD922|nr:helix-turn-helix domain-containing protein [Streptomyces sp. JJ36]MCF6524391.1 transcriptional regulator [Streptomyces sp. JJ36]